MYLADLGADVVKIERPGSGDDSRTWGPPFVGKDSAWFLSANRGKRSLALDLAREPACGAHATAGPGGCLCREPEPRQARPARPPAGGLRLRFPHLIYCSVSGFGLDGPERDALSYDLIAQARSGLMSVTGAAGGAPQRVSTALSDVVAGMLAALTISAALVRRAARARGADRRVAARGRPRVDGPSDREFPAGETEPRPSGGTDSVLALYQPFETADRPIVVAVGNDGMWRRFCEATGLDELAGDPALDTNAGRRRHRPHVIAAAAARLRERPAAEWLERFRQHRVPCGPIQGLSEVVSDRQVVAREAITTLDCRGGEQFRGVGTPWHLASDDRADRKPPPLLGEDGANVLHGAGYDERQIESLIEGGALWVPSPPRS